MSISPLRSWRPMWTGRCRAGRDRRPSPISAAAASAARRWSRSARSAAAGQRSRRNSSAAPLTMPGEIAGKWMPSPAERSCPCAWLSVSPPFSWWRWRSGICSSAASGWACLKLCKSGSAEPTVAPEQRLAPAPAEPAVTARGAADAVRAQAPAEAPSGLEAEKKTASGEPAPGVAPAALPVTSTAPTDTALKQERLRVADEMATMPLRERGRGRYRRCPRRGRGAAGKG